MNTYRLVWLDGREEIVRGGTIDHACSKAGIGGGALAALDYLEQVKNDDLLSCPCGTKTPRGKFGSVVYCDNCGALL